MSRALSLLKPVLGFLFPHRRVDVEGAAEGQGAGCAAVAPLPEQFLIPGLDTKFAVSYQRLMFDREGASRRGHAASHGPAAGIRIDGPPPLQAEMPQGIYRATTVDVGEPGFMWSADGDVGPHVGAKTSVRFPSAAGGHARGAGHRLRRRS